METLLSWGHTGTLTGLALLISALIFGGRYARIAGVIGYVVVVLSLSVAVTAYASPDPSVNTYPISGR